MIFAQQHGSSFVDAAQSATAVLLLGCVGQGVGLLSDVLAATAAECELPTHCEELHGFARLRPLSAAAVWLGASELPPASTGFDVVVALDQAAIREAYRLVRPSGRILLPLRHNDGPDGSKFAHGARYDGILSPVQRLPVAGPAHGKSTASVSYLAGCLSGCVSLPMHAWQAALDAHLRPRDRRIARTLFAAGRRLTRR